MDDHSLRSRSILCGIHAAETWSTLVRESNPDWDLEWRGLGQDYDLGPYMTTAGICFTFVYRDPFLSARCFLSTYVEFIDISLSYRAQERNAFCPQSSGRRQEKYRIHPNTHTEGSQLGKH